MLAFQTDSCVHSEGVKLGQKHRHGTALNVRVIIVPRARVHVHVMDRALSD